MFRLNPLAIFALVLLLANEVRGDNLPLVGVWNGYLRQENVAECLNLSSQSVGLTLSLKNLSGETITSIPFDIGPRGVKHIPLNPHGIAEKYGLFVVDSSPSGSQAPIKCFTSVYRFAAANSAKAVDYAFVHPQLNAIVGESAGVFNSMNPESSPNPVFNFLSLINPGTEPFSADVKIYDQNGKPKPELNFTVEGLRPFERRDYALGHEQGQVLGLYRILPRLSYKPYGAFLSRYSLGSKGIYNFALTLGAYPGSCDSGPLPASTMDPALNWGEIANPSSEPVVALVKVLSRSGETLLDETVTVPAFAQHHFLLNQTLGSSNVGSFWVKCSEPNNPAKKLLVQSLYYGRTNESSSELSWGYATQARNATIQNKAFALPINTYLGMSNWGKLLSSQTIPLALQNELFNEPGQIMASGSVSIPASGSADLALRELAGRNFVGLGLFYPTGSSSLYPELLRVFPHSSAKIGYIMNITGFPANLSRSEKRDVVLSDYLNNYLSTNGSFSWNGSTTSCNAGTVPQEIHDKTVKRINYFRRQVGLPDDVVLDSARNLGAQQAALMMLANGSLSHSPPSTWKCYTNDGKTAAGSSNLYLGVASVDAITGYIYDPGSNNTAVGHRRWILYSRAKVMGNGSTNGSQALWAIGDFGPTPTSMPQFIAWPPSGYVVSNLVFPRWSFSIPGASFTGTTVQVLKSNGTALPVLVHPVVNGYGDNTIVFEPSGIETYRQEDTTYTVKISNVVVSSVVKNFEYQVTLIQPN